MNSPKHISKSSGYGIVAMAECAISSLLGTMGHVINWWHPLSHGRDLSTLALLSNFDPSRLK